MTVALLLIDIQKGLLPDAGQSYDGVKLTRSNHQAEQNASTLLHHARQHQLPVYHVKHNSVNAGSLLRPELPTNAINELVQPLDTEPLYTKSVNGAFTTTTLHANLQAAHIDTLVLCGLTTDHCVSTTARQASDLGYNVYLVHDACATFERQHYDTNKGLMIDADMLHNANVASLHNEFVTAVDTQYALKLLQNSTHH